MNDLDTAGLELPMHVPLCWRQPFAELPTHPARGQYLEFLAPLPIYISVATPPALLAIKPVEQTRVLAEALLTAIEHDLYERPWDKRLVRRFHQFIAGQTLWESTGTTIAVTSYEHGGSAVLAATWDHGEDYTAMLARLATARRIGRLPAAVARVLYERPARAASLPPPQAVLSNVIPVGIMRGGNWLGGYSDGAAASPIIVAALGAEIHIRFDHRIYNPPDEQALATALLAELARRIAPVVE